MNKIPENNLTKQNVDKLATKLKRLQKERSELVRKKMAYNGKCDLYFLLKNIIGRKEHTFDKEHIKIIRILEDFWMNPNQRDLLLLSPRGSRKTSLATIGFTILRIINDPDIRINIANEKQDNAMKFLKEIRDHFSSNQKFIDVYGDWTSKKHKWTEEQLTVAQRTKVLKEPTVSISSPETSIVSQHVDLIIFDDVVSRANTQNGDQINKVIQFYKDMRSILDPKGKRIIIGTRWASNDLYAHLIKQMDSDSDSINGESATDSVKEQYL